MTDMTDNSDKGEPFSKLNVRDDVDKIPYHPTSTAISNAVAGLIKGNDVDAICDVDVSVSGKWVTFEGRVDSQEMRTALFDLVPARDGKRYIVDRLQVTYDFGSGGVQ